jgi:hypothetical protein
MDELLRRISANGFAEIEGLQVSGTLPVRQDIVNEIITSLVRDAQTDPAPKPAAAPTAPAAGTSSLPEVNWWKLVNKLQVVLRDGKLVIDFELRR